MANGVTANKLAQAYQMAGLYRDGRDGSGITVAVVEPTPYSAADLATFATCYGIGAPDVVDAFLGNPSARLAPSWHATDVVETLLSIAPRVHVRFYETDGVLLQPWYSALRASIEAEPSPSIVSISSRWCEIDLSSSLADLDGLFQEAAARHESVVAGSGNQGSSCLSSNAPTLLRQTLTHRLAGVGFPASDPWVTGVGGTSLHVTGTGASETVWNTNGTPPRSILNTALNASGGGVSRYFAMPGYQDPFGKTPDSSGAPCGLARPKNPRLPATVCREVPDVSASADSRTGYVTFSDGSWNAVGGTSFATPLWAGLVALMDQGCGSDQAGFLNPKLYDAARRSGYPAGTGSAFHDVTAGNNDVSKSGIYPARTGYDLATGLGTPDAAHLAPYLSCKPVVTSVSPTEGPKAGGDTVSIQGAGFDWGSAVQVKFGTQSAAHTTVISPGLIEATAPSSGWSGSVDLTVTTPVGTSATSPRDSYTYVPAPGGVTSVGDPGFSSWTTGGPLLFASWRAELMHPDGPAGPGYSPLASDCVYRPATGLVLQPYTGLVEQGLEHITGHAEWQIAHLTPGWRYQISIFLPRSDCLARSPDSSSFAVRDAQGAHTTGVEQDGRRSGWVPLGTYRTPTSGRITVTLAADLQPGVLASGGVGLGWIVPPEVAYASSVRALPDTTGVATSTTTTVATPPASSRCNRLAAGAWDCSPGFAGPWAEHTVVLPGIRGGSGPAGGARISYWQIADQPHGSATATWRFGGLRAGGSYELQATQPPTIPARTLLHYVVNGKSETLAAVPHQLGLASAAANRTGTITVSLTNDASGNALITAADVTAIPSRPPRAGTATTTARPSTHPTTTLHLCGCFTRGP